MISRQFVFTWSLALLVLSASQASVAVAGDSNVSSNGEESGGHAEVGFGVFAERSARDFTNDNINSSIEFTFDLAYQNRGFFFEAADEEFDLFSAGYTVVDNNDWTVDLLAINVSNALSIARPDDLSGPTPQETARNDEQFFRSRFSNGSGLRVSRYFGNSLLRAVIGTDTFKGNGPMASVHLGHQLQIGNWDVRGVIGARYHSSELNNYYWGVDAEQSTERFPEYKTGSALIGEARVGVAYPLSKHWVFRSRMLYQRLPGSVTASPFINRDYSVFFSATLNYVF